MVTQLIDELLNFSQNIFSRDNEFVSHSVCR